MGVQPWQALSEMVEVSHAGRLAKEFYVHSAHTCPLLLAGGADID